MNKPELLDYMESKTACSPAMDWVKDTEGTPQELWDQCSKADWLLWLAEEAGVERTILVHCASDCAERALRFVPEEEDRPRLAIEAARAWANEPTEGNRLAAQAAGDAAGDAGAALRAAARAAWAAWDAADAAYAADAAWAAWAAAAWAAEWAAENLELCKLVRKRVTWDMVAAAIKTQKGTYGK